MIGSKRMRDGTRRYSSGLLSRRSRHSRALINWEMIVAECSTSNAELEYADKQKIEHDIDDR